MFPARQTLQRFAVIIPLTYFAILMKWFYQVPGLTTDGQTYLQIARNLHYGIGLGWQALWFPPLHSILIAAVAFLPGAHDLQIAAGVVSVSMGLLLTVSLYALATQLFNRLTGVIATVTVLSFPHVVHLHASAEAEITYTAFLMAALALLLAAIRRSSYIFAAAAGVTFALAYLSRSEGFMIMVLTLTVLCVTKGIRFYKSLLAKLCMTVVILFFVTSSPYLLFLHHHYGAFVISPKLTYVSIWMKSKIYHDNDKGETRNDELWGLTPEGKLKWQQPTGVRELATYLMSHPAKSLAVYGENLVSHMPGRIPNASGTLHFPQVFPVYIAIFAVLASFLSWGQVSPQGKTVVFAPLLILLVLPVFTGGWCKYLVPYAPLLIIAATGGLYLLAERLTTYLHVPATALLTTMVPSMILALLAGYYLVIALQVPASSTSDFDIGRGKYTAEARNAGRMARERFGPGRNYMVGWNKMIYHLDGLWTPEPITTFTNMIKFARRNKVDFVVWENLDREVSDEELQNAGPGLHLVGVYRSREIVYTASFYELVRCESGRA
jgi:4-amino-4-deoxy-L-arabinose transferase-like glycosyltransferase